MIKDFSIFIDESYLDSNYAPLYHFTTIWSLNSTFKSNKLSLGFYNHEINNKVGKIVSLTRLKDFDISYRDFECKICLDKNKLVNNYNLRPYEHEEVTNCEIKDLNKYILYVDFFSLEPIYQYLSDIKTYVNKYNIECRISEKIIDINAI